MSGTGTGRGDLSPGMVWLLDLAGKANLPKLEDLTIDAARRQYLDTANRLDRKPAAMEAVTDLAVERPGAEPGETPEGQPGDLRIRIYRPKTLAEPAPALLWFHGGGWVVGSVETTDAVCRGLADGAAAAVISVEYRMGPEAPFPAAIEDAELAWDWLAANAAPLGLDPARIAVGGDSAGGNISAVLAHQCRGKAVRPAFQLLIYPGTDMSREHPSVAENAAGYMLEKSTMDWFRGHYMPDDGQRSDPRASPLLSGRFDDLPPAHVQTAGFDPLRDEGIAYVRAMTDAGVAVEHRHDPGLVHGYFNMSGAIAECEVAFQDAVAALRRAFGT